MTGSGGPVAVFSGGGTGGHLYPALTLADTLKRLRPDVRTYFVGARRGVEARVLPERGVEHTLLPVEGFSRDRLWANLRVLRILVGALRELTRLFQRLRPHLVVVTGGYAGGPAGLVAGILGVRLVIQEQNAVPGLTSRVLSLWAREVHLAFPEARDWLPSVSRHKARMSGNPVAPPVPLDPGEARSRFGLDPEGTVVLVVGGSQGSRALNQAVSEAVAGILRDELHRPPPLQLLWATGPAHEEAIRRELGGEGKPSWLRIVGYIQEMPAALAAATLAVSRGGAMATSEFLAWGLPAVLVPLPTAAADHQTRNAVALEAAGAAVHLPEAELDAKGLWSRVLELVEDRDRLHAMSGAARARGRPQAARAIAESLARHLPRRAS